MTGPTKIDIELLGIADKLGEVGFLLRAAFKAMNDYDEPDPVQVVILHTENLIDEIKLTLDGVRDAGSLVVASSSGRAAA